jgi:DDE superfamily endonuclease
VAAKHPDALSCRPPSGRPWNVGNEQPRSPQGSRGGDGWSCCWLLGTPNPLWPRGSASSGASCVNGPNAFSPNASTGLLTPRAAVPRAGFPPDVAIPVVRLACERPDPLGRSLSQWDGTELARQLVADGIVENISAATVRRILAAQQLKPWRQHVWLSPKQPRAAAFDATVSELLDLDTRPLRPDELGLSVDEKTSLQPRPRCAPTLPAQPHTRPNRVEHEYKRAGARHRLAAFDTRSGKVYGYCNERKRQREFIAVLETLETEIDEYIRTIHLVCDHVSTPHGKEVSTGFAHHPRVVVHFTPVHCSWMNQVEQWFSILQRKRLRIVDFESKDHLRAKIAQFIQEWNQHAHPFNWSTTSVAKVMAAAPALAA